MNAFTCPSSIRHWAACGLGLLAAGAHGQTRSPQPLWELGAFAVGISQQAYPGSDQNIQRVLALPFFLYRGEFLRADRETAGLRAVRTPSFEVDLGVAGSFGASSNDIEARRGMPNLGTLVEFGPRVKVNLGVAAGGRWRLELPVRGVFDLSDGLAHRGLAFEPEISFARRSPLGFEYSAGLSAIVGDRPLARTFYGVDAPFARPDRPAYAAEAGLIAWRGTLGVSAPLGPDWRLFGFARLDSVTGAANRASPLVKSTHGASVGLGVAYTWRRSGTMAAD
jgi:MipA family protein